jgi:N-dimethylarginine dimethylaminohydrolase
MTHQKNVNAAAFGGEKWSPRLKTHREEIGEKWLNCGINSEWSKLKHVLLHTPGPEFSSIKNADDFQMLEVPNWEIAREQHFALAQAYKDLGVKVTYVQPDVPSSPNQIFCADLLFMTPEGAILSRPASTVRAGEERWVARRLAEQGIPILTTLQGEAVFEGADALWVNPKTVIIGRGLRTNEIAINQIENVLKRMGVELIPVDLPIGTMHLMGILRFINEDMILTWPYRLAWKAVEILRSNGYKVDFIPDEREATINEALNFVTTGPGEVVMAGGNPNTQTYLESRNIKVHTVDVNELQKAAGGIGCLTGILERELIGKKRESS